MAERIYLLGELIRTVRDALLQGRLPAEVMLSLFLLCLFLLWECRLLFAGVSVVNIGWDGKERFRGRVFLRRARGVYFVRLPGRMLEASETTRFRIKCGALFLLRHGREGLLVLSGNETRSAERASGMEFTLRGE